MNNNDVKVKYLALSKKVFEYIDANDNSTINEVSEGLQMYGQSAYRIILRLLKDGFLSRTPDKRNIQFIAINRLHFKEHQEAELAKYIQNRKVKLLTKTKVKVKDMPNVPDHIKEAIKRGLISPDMVRSHSPMEDTPEKFSGNRPPNRNSVWLGYSSFNIV